MDVVVERLTYPHGVSRGLPHSMKSTLGAGSFIRHNSAMLTRLHKYAQPLAFHPSRFSSPFGNEIEDVHGYGFKRNYRYTGYRFGSIPQGDFPTRHCLEFRASLGRSPAWGGVLELKCLLGLSLAGDSYPFGKLKDALCQRTAIII